MAKKKPSKSGPVSVDIVSDIVCPWCWLGKQYFDAAVKSSGRKIEVTWRPYMLDPTVPTEGAPYRAYMKKKFGDAPDNRFTAMREHLEAAAPDTGITFRFSELTVRRKAKSSPWAAPQKRLYSKPILTTYKTLAILKS
jgi:predicted DsbA family dithiol-disulfide isomerase